MTDETSPDLRTRYEDLPQMWETFADSKKTFIWNGTTLRIEFTVTRLEEVIPNQPRTGRRRTSCRLVLPPEGIVQLFNRCQQLGSALVQAGVLKQAPTPPAPQPQ